jgi:hypothetical protein
MEIKYTKHFLNKLENIFSESDYILRYEKGNFQSGYCILNETKVAVVNRFYTLEGKINCLIDILRSVAVNPEGMSDKSKHLLRQITQKEIRL